MNPGTGFIHDIFIRLFLDNTSLVQNSTISTGVVFFSVETLFFTSLILNLALSWSRNINIRIAYQAVF